MYLSKSTKVLALKYTLRTKRKHAYFAKWPIYAYVIYHNIRLKLLMHLHVHHLNVAAGKGRAIFNCSIYYLVA